MPQGKKLEEEVATRRTVSRYLPDPLTRRSQTCRTFLANHIASLAFASSVTSSFATCDDDVDASVLPFRPVPPSRDGRYASTQWALVDWSSSRQSTSVGRRVAQDQLRRRTRFSSGKDPPQSWAVEPVPAGKRLRFLRFETPSRPKELIGGLRRKQALGRSVRKQVVRIAGEPTPPRSRR